MAGRIYLKLLTDFFNKIGQQRRFGGGTLCPLFTRSQPFDVVSPRRYVQQRPFSLREHQCVSVDAH